MDKNICFVGSFCHIPSIIGLLERVNLVVDARFGDG